MENGDRKPIARPLIKSLDVKLGDATDFEIAKDFNEELPFMIHCKRCGMAFLKEWRQQRLLYRHQRLYPGDCSTPPQFSVDSRLVLWESLRTVLDKTAVDADATVLELLRTRVVNVMVDHNSPGPGHTRLHRGS
jgi:hypothetical protein